MWQCKKKYVERILCKHTYTAIYVYDIDKKKLIRDAIRVAAMLGALEGSE